MLSKSRLIARTAAAAAIWGFMSLSAQAAAFGVDRGTPVKSLKIERTVSPNFYAVTVPLPNPEFSSYLALATAGSGVCKVSAVGRDHPADRYGTEVDGVFDGFVKTLSAKYGPSKDFDFLKTGALWDKPEDWAMAIKENERTKASFWTRENGAHLPDDVASIALQVRSVSVNTTYVSLTYEFTNFDQCVAEMKSATDAGL